ncbi:MFS transporter [Actinomadura flavalba]|uniref:MFS transporter n=1 Tax=Actinomadura flavalba TaxID=1120938 RepID=UPI00036E8C4F|nr:MFS transporter [Actinomadura flavalba]
MKRLRTHAALAVLLLPALLTSMDLSILFVASPTIAAELRPSATAWLWIMDVYGFVMAGLLITMGALGDRFGRRRMLLGGAALFGTASALLALADSPAWLIAGRALLGVGGATLAPSTLSLLRSLYPGERERRAAVAAWTVAFTGGAVAGPIVGGLLLEHFWWGSVFLINVPVMLVLLVAAPLLVPESRAAEPTPFDLPGAVLSLAALFGLVYAIKQVAEEPREAAVAGAVGAAAAVAFAVRQRRAAHPLLDLGLLRRPLFASAVLANTVMTLAVAGLGALAFTLLQTVHGMGPLEAALWALPTIAGTFAGAGLASAVGERVRPAVPLAGGLLVSAAGFVVVATQTAEPWMFIAGYTVVTFGVGVTGTAANALVLTAAPPERAGTAAGLSETSTELGAALGIAVLGTLATEVYRRAMDAVAPGTPAAETVAAAPHLPEARAAFVDGLTVAASTAAVALTLIALLLALWVGRGAVRKA